MPQRGYMLIEKHSLCFSESSRGATSNYYQKHTSGTKKKKNTLIQPNRSAGFFRLNLRESFFYADLSA